MRFLVLANNDVGLYKFRKELLSELLQFDSGLVGTSDKKSEVFVSLPYGDNVCKLEELGCKYIETKVNRRGLNPIEDIQLFLFYKKLIRNLKPDVVLTYTIKPNVYGGLACGKKVKNIATVTGVGTAMQGNNFLSKFTSFLYRIGVKNSNAIFFQNIENQRLFEKENITSGLSMIVSGSGVNLDEYSYMNYPNNEIIKLAFIGRIMKNKGIDEYLECAQFFYNNGIKIEFGIAGEFDDEAYRNKIEELSKAGIVNYYGFKDDINSFIASYDAVVLPSYHEGMSNVLLEAAACGKPLLASNISGCKEIIEHGKTGFCFDAKNTESLISSIQAFCSLSYEERRTMGIAGRKKVEIEFDRRNVTKAYIDVIKKI